jgi:hypothetical protein
VNCRRHRSGFENARIPFATALIATLPRSRTIKIANIFHIVPAPSVKIARLPSQFHQRLRHVRTPRAGA